MEKLTISVAEQIESELGITQRIHKKQGEGSTEESRIIFKKDTQQQRDLEIRNQVIQEIMENRNVSREEAEKILANPF